MENNDGIQDDPYVVVTTEYPSCNGCYRGKKEWSRAEIIVNSQVDVSKETFHSYEDAAQAARVIRDINCQFEGYGENEDYDNNNDNKNDDPPFDSGDLENYDDDSHVRIEVMTKSQIEAQIDEDQLYLEKARSKKYLEALLDHRLMRCRIKDSGGVHYSRPSQPYDIPAELEIIENDISVDINSYELPTNAASIKSFMYKGKRGDFARFLSTYNLSNQHAFFRVIRACTSLEELYITSDDFQDTLEKEFINTIISKAPHLRHSLKILSINQMFVAPDAIPIFQEFLALKRLDLTGALSSQYWEENNDDQSFGEGEEETLPYDDVLEECVNALPQLKRLDLGCGDWESKRYLRDYALSSQSLECVKFIVEQDKGGTVTMSNDNVPEQFRSNKRETAARSHVLVSIMNDPGLPKGVRSLAKESVKVCRCHKPATKRCTACERQWYCSVDCQRKHFRMHKPICDEKFDG